LGAEYFGTFSRIVYRHDNQETYFYILVFLLIESEIAVLMSLIRAHLANGYLSYSPVYESAKTNGHPVVWESVFSCNFAS
jgi:hypothetical protein